MKFCGAKTRDGTPCKGKAMANGRCRMHGGTNKGAPKANNHSLKHGIYSTAYTEEELAMLNEIKLGSVDDELKVAKIRLRRALIAEFKNDENSALELIAKTESPSIMGGLPDYTELVTTLQYKKTDYSPIIDRLLARIESLERTRIDLMSSGADDSSEVQPVKITIDVKDARKREQD